MLLDKIKVVDARMGRGKTTAAINYMTENAGKKRFLYITPYLKEVERVCSSCDFDQPTADKSTKLAELKRMLRSKKNIVTTHSLFYHLDKATLDIIQSSGYCLIVDEAIDVVRKPSITMGDISALKNHFMTKDEEGFLHWTDDEYDGLFYSYKKMCETWYFVDIGGILINVMRPEVLMAFSEVFMMTYLFEGNCMMGYLEYFKIPYEYYGIDDRDGFRFVKGRDNPPPTDFKALISIVMDERMNDVGQKYNALSHNWFNLRSRDDDDISKVRAHLNTFFVNNSKNRSKDRLWTTFKTSAPKLYGSRNRYSTAFLQLTAKATNEYRDKRCIAYLANRFIDPNMSRFFRMHDVYIDQDKFALADMLQWIWRSCIRDDEPILLYVPSRRMRVLLLNWLEEMNGGSATHKIEKEDIVDEEQGDYADEE